MHFTFSSLNNHGMLIKWAFLVLKAKACVGYCVSSIKYCGEKIRCLSNANILGGHCFFTLQKERYFRIFNK